MKAPRADTLFRIGGLLACVNVVLPLLARVATGDIARILRESGVEDVARINLPGTRAILVLGQLTALAVLATAFWLNTRPGTIDPPRRRAVGLLLFQSILALGATDYFVIVAAQSPFVFPPRAALKWLAFQLTLFTTYAALAARAGMEVIIPEVAGSPAGVAVVVSIAYIAAWQVFAFSVGYLAASERRSRHELERGNHELLATQQMLADSSRVAERAEISRELHDTVGHNLAVLNVNLELASHLTQGRAAEAIGKAQTVARLLLADVREVVHALGETRAIDLRRALATLVAGTHAPAVHLEMPPDVHVSDPSKAHAIFRCVQEAMTNSVRHARARNLWVELIPADTGLDVRIRDDGRGAAEVRAGYGLQGMRERIESVGGSLHVATTAGRGFSIQAWFPAPEETP